MRSTRKAWPMLGMFAAAAMLLAPSARAQDWYVPGRAASAQNIDLSADVKRLEEHLNVRLAGYQVPHGQLGQLGTHPGHVGHPAHHGHHPSHHAHMGHPAPMHCEGSHCGPPSCEPTPCEPAPCEPSCCAPPTCGAPCCTAPSFCEPGCGVPHACFTDHCKRSQGWVYSVEGLYVKPHSSEGTGLPDANDANDFGFDLDFAFAYRAWLGYSRCDGLGVRTAYFAFDDEFDDTVLANDVSHEWDTFYWDVEVTNATRLGCHWDALFSFGARCVEYEETRTNETVNDSTSVEFEGFGMVVGSEFRRRFGCNYTFFSRLRTSVVMGDEEFTLIDGGVVQADESVDFINDIKWIYEATAGLEYTVPICGGGYYYVRVAGEVQYWDGFGVPFDGDNDNEQAFGLGGISIAAGLHR